MKRMRRPKGSRNKTSQVLSRAILLAAENVGEEKKPGHPDGKLVAYLEDIAQTEPIAFIGLLGKLLPSQIAEEEVAPPVVHICFEGPDKDAPILEEKAAA